MNRVVLTGRLTRDPEMRSLASGKTVTTFSDAVAHAARPPRIATPRGPAAEDRDAAQTHQFVTRTD